MSSDPAAPVAGTDVVERPCPDCDGDGFTVRGTCSWCHGTGKWNEEEQNRARYETHPVGTATEITRLRAEVEELRTSVVAFGAPWAVRYAEQHGAPKGALHHRHYDILAAAGARMVEFTRWVPGDER